MYYQLCLRVLFELIFGYFPYYIFTGEVCTNIKLVTSIYANEISWSFGQCNSNETGQEYTNNNTFTDECCQEAGSYELICHDSYGDGWNGGYIEIEGNQYCNKFFEHEHTEEATMSTNFIIFSYHVMTYYFPHLHLIIKHVITVYTPTFLGGSDVQPTMPPTTGKLSNRINNKQKSCHTFLLYL